MQHLFTVIEDSSEPVKEFPESLEGKKVLLKCTGGVGDVLMAIGSSAKLAKQMGSEKVYACVKDHHRALTSMLYGVDRVYPTASSNYPEFLDYFDVYVDFVGIFNNRLNLIKSNYYDAISKRLTKKVGVGEFTFNSCVQPRWVAIHPGASNPNRAWEEERWGRVALSLRDAGFAIHWLGCKDEYGFSSENIFKLSDYSEDLVYQSVCLSRCNYFLGNDSGFSHVAGLLGTVGAVLFSSTHPDDVIRDYKNLSSVHKFESYDDPTRSLGVSDSRSLDFLDAIQVEDVLEKFGGVPVSDAKLPEQGKAGTVGVVVNTPLTEELKALMPFVDEKYDIVKLDKEEFREFPVISQSDGITYIIRGGKKFRISVANRFGFLRALREVGR